MATNNIILRKNVFWSMLEYALPIPVESQLLYTAITGKDIEVGGRHDIKLLIGGQIYDAYFHNVGFNRNTFTHSPIIRLSYGQAVKKQLQKIFCVSYEKLKKQGEEYKRLHPTGRVRIDDDETDEFVVLSATADPDVFAIDCVTHDMVCDVQNDIVSVNEEIFEQIDDNAGITLSSAVHKIRALDRSIGQLFEKVI